MISRTFLVSKLGILFLGPPACPNVYRSPWCRWGGREWVPSPEASPEDGGTPLMGLGREGSSVVQALSLTVPFRRGHSSKPGPETGGPQRPDWQFPATSPEPAPPQRGLTKPQLSPSSPLRAKQKPRNHCVTLGWTLHSGIPVSSSDKWG